jgi:hypothetical protein
MGKKRTYELKVEEREAVEVKIKQVEQYLEGAAELLKILHGR